MNSTREVASMATVGILGGPCGDQVRAAVFYTGYSLRQFSPRLVFIVGDMCLSNQLLSNQLPRRALEPPPTDVLVSPTVCEYT